MEIDAPPPRIRFSCSKVDDNQFILFGGSGGVGHSSYWNDVFILEVTAPNGSPFGSPFAEVPPEALQWRWKEPHQISGDIPPARYGHTATVLNVAGRNSLVVFGGKGVPPNHGLLNDVHVLDIETLVWRSIVPKGEQPSPRYYHSAVRIGDHEMLVFGGRTEHEESNQSFILNTKDMIWTQPVFNGKAPSKRYQHFAYLYTPMDNSPKNTNNNNTDKSGSEIFFPARKELHIFGPRKMIIYGGIKKMTSLQDVVILDIETMTWSRPSVNMEDRHRGSHEYSVLCHNKLLVFDFEKMASDGVLNYFNIASKKSGHWETIGIAGDNVDSSQFSSLYSLSPDIHFFIELHKKGGVVVLQTSSKHFEQKKLSMKRIAAQSTSAHPERLIPEGSTEIEIECHFASTSHFVTNLVVTSTFQEFQDLVGNHYGLGEDEFVIFFKKNAVKSDKSKRRVKYILLTEDIWIELMGTHRQFFAPFQFYLAAKASSEREPKNDVSQLAEDVVGSPAKSLTGSENSNMLKPADQHINSKQYHSRQKLPFRIEEAPRSLLESQFIDEKEKDVVLPLPMLYQKVKKLSLLRRIHKRMKYFEFWGSRARETAVKKSTNVQAEDEEKHLLLHTEKPKKKHTHNHFEINRFMKALFRWLTFWITGVYFAYVNHSKYAFRERIFAVLFQIFFLACLVLPVLGELYWDNDKQQQGVARQILYTPLFLAVLFCITMANIESIYKDPKKETKELAKYHVTIFQTLVTGVYGERKATADDVVFSIMHNEERTKDAKLYWFLAFIFSPIAAFCHVGTMFFYLISAGDLHFSHQTISHIITAIVCFLNFASVWGYLFVLGVALAVYARHLKHVYLFSMMTSKDHAKNLELPTLPLRSSENIIAWIKIRTYLNAHQFLPLTSTNVILGWCMLVAVFLWSFIIIDILSFDDFISGISVLSFYDALVLCVYIIITLVIGVFINGWHRKHLAMLFKEQLKLNLEIGKLKTELLHTKNNNHAHHTPTTHRRVTSSTLGAALTTSEHPNQGKHSNHVQFHPQVNSSYSRPTLSEAEKLEHEIEHLENSKELLEIVAKIIELQDENFKILGFSISEGAIKVILGLLISTTVAVVAKLGLDFTNVD